jgi:hypothetical protein
MIMALSPIIIPICARGAAGAAGAEAAAVAALSVVAGVLFEHAASAVEATTIAMRIRA